MSRAVLPPQSLDPTDHAELRDQIAEDARAARDGAAAVAGGDYAGMSYIQLSLYKGTMKDAEDYLEKVQRITAFVERQMEGIEDKLSKAYRIINKAGIRDLSQASLRTLMGHANRDVANAARDALEMEASVERNNALIANKKDVEREIQAMLDYPDTYFTKGTDGKHLDRVRYQALTTKPGQRSADDKADLEMFGVIVGGGGAEPEKKRARKE